jgi:hypothetical protein
MILGFVKNDEMLRRDQWAHLLSPTCRVELPFWATKRIGIPEGSTFGDATRSVWVTSNEFLNYVASARDFDGEQALYSDGPMSDLIPCACSSAEMDNTEILPGWAAAKFDLEPTSTVGEAAQIARARLHDRALRYLESDWAPVPRDMIERLLWDDCDVVLPRWASEMLGLHEASTFGDASWEDAWSI